MQNRKILIVSYYWFPFSGTGMYRISKFTKYLLKLGWEPIILTAEKSTGNLVNSRIDPIYKKIPVHRTPIFEPAELLQPKSKEGSTHAINPSIFYGEDNSLKQQLAVWIRLNILIPDAKISWRFLGLSKGKKIIEDEKPALIFSTSPPPTAHLLAAKLAEWSGLPWLADFRDPWTNIYYYDDVQMNPIAQRINKKLEHSVLERADRITLVNDGFFPACNLEQKAVVIKNGYDWDDYPEQVPDRDNEKFTICYTGSLKMNQYPDSLIQALRKISENEPEIAQKIGLKFYGNIESRFIDELRQPDILCETCFPGLVSHKEAIEQMARADMQLLVIGKQPRSKPVVSTKAFEYMMSEKPILGIGPSDGAAAQLIRETGTGFFFDHGDCEGVKKCIVNAYNAWEQDEVVIDPNHDKIEKYDFKNLTLRLEEIINSMLDNS